jgi:hypothetical protein
VKNASVTSGNRRACRRRQPRRTTKVSCRLGVPGVGPELATSLLDLSECGVRALLAAALDSGQKVEVGLTGLWQRQTLKLAAEVVWCLATTDGRWCVGVKFDQRLALPDLETLAFAN